uniref:Dynein light chain Tctex-type 1 n=1 Tax=Castor canadensis TaxID=51338 RepID=A0A8C0WER1_CASCN
AIKSLIFFSWSPFHLHRAAKETAFVVDEVNNIVKEAIESAIGGNAYQHSKVNQWTTNVVEQTLSQLTKLGKPFKYIVTCVIIQKNGAGLHTASSCFWELMGAALCDGRTRPCTASSAPLGCPSDLVQPVTLLVSVFLLRF